MSWRYYAAPTYTTFWDQVIIIYFTNKIIIIKAN
jgi:hypothetical protein